RMFGWTKQLPVSILTNFGEFAVYDCRFEPLASDNAAVARVLYLTFREYVERWDELVALFSPEAVFKGSFDKFVESRKWRGAALFDERFLDVMEHWRKRLAENIALRNPEVSKRDLNYAVQQTIDRLVARTSPSPRCRRRSAGRRWEFRSGTRDTSWWWYRRAVP